MSEILPSTPCAPCAINEQLSDRLSRFAAYQHGVVETLAEGMPEYPPSAGEIANKRSILPLQAQASVACIYMKLAGLCPDECQKIEAEPHVEELGHLVEGLDFRKVVAWAKDQDIPGHESLHDMVGSKVISIDGKKAAVGWVAKGPGGRYDVLTPEIEVANPGGEDMIIVEGSVSVLRRPNAKYPPTTSAAARGNRPGFLQFDGGETVQLLLDDKSNKKCWYVCFYPEVEQ